MNEETVKYVEARWVAPFVADSPGLPRLIPGQTVVEIPEPEAIASEHWEVISGDSGKVTAKSLRAEAKKLKLDIPPRAKKADLEELIAAHREEVSHEEVGEEQAETAAEEQAGVEPEPLAEDPAEAEA